jgi:PAS domain-containing protein
VDFAKHTALVDVEYAAADTKKSLESTLLIHGVVDSYFALANYSVDFYRDYVPFMTKANLNLPSMNGVFVGSIVDNSSRIAYEAQMKALGRGYSNFRINVRDENNVASYAPFNVSQYFPYVMAYPEARLSGSLGFDINSDASRGYVAQNSIANGGTISLTSKINLSSANATGVGTFKVNKEKRYFSSVTFRLDLLLGTQAAIPLIESKYFIQYWDTSNPGAGILYSSAKKSDYSYNVAPDKLTEAQHRQMANDAPFFVQENFNISDRVYMVVLVSKGITYSYQRWLGLFFTLGAGVLLSIMVFSFIKIYQYSVDSRKRDQVRVNTLNIAKNKVSLVMDRLSEQDNRARTTLDALPDMIAVINRQTKIILSNVNFQTHLDRTKDAILRQVLPDVYDLNTIDQNTIAITSFKKQIDVCVTIIPFEAYDENDAHDWSHVVIIRDMSERNTLLDRATKQKEKLKRHLRHARFDAQFNNVAFQESLLDFCRKNRNAESVMFLIDVAKYKKMKMEKRMQRKNEIFNTYIRIDAPEQLNISFDNSRQMEKKVAESLGELDLFEEIADLMRNSLLTDIFPRFLARNSEL